MNIAIKKKRAFKGLSLPENKITAKKPIEILPVPDKVVIPLQQSLGAPCQFKVVNPVTSTMMDSIIIESDGEDNWVELKKLFDIKKSDDFPGLKKIIDSI